MDSPPSSSIDPAMATAVGALELRVAELRSKCHVLAWRLLGVSDLKGKLVTTKLSELDLVRLISQLAYAQREYVSERTVALVTWNWAHVIRQRQRVRDALSGEIYAVSEFRRHERTAGDTASPDRLAASEIESLGPYIDKALEAALRVLEELESRSGPARR